MIAEILDGVNFSLQVCAWPAFVLFACAVMLGELIHG